MHTVKLLSPHESAAPISHPIDRIGQVIVEPRLHLFVTRRH
jgi:hypothetical protein